MKNKNLNMLPTSESLDGNDPHGLKVDGKRYFMKMKMKKFMVTYSYQVN